MAGLGAAAACVAHKKKTGHKLRSRSKSPVRAPCRAPASVNPAVRTVEALYRKLSDGDEAGVSREQTRHVLAELTNQSPESVDEDDLDIVRRRACNLRLSPPASGRTILEKTQVAAVAPAVAGPFDASGDGDVFAVADVVDEREARLPKAPLVEATMLYAAYLDHKPAVDAVYSKFGTTKSGQLTPGQLRDALESMERKSGGHQCFGISFQVIPSRKDVVRIIEKCDLDQDGYINRIELIPALKVWRTIADKHADAQTSVCSLM